MRWETPLSLYHHPLIPSSKRRGEEEGGGFASILDWLSDKIIKAKEVVAEKITTKKARLSELEMIDKTTGEIYCTWIENSEWVKEKGECGQSQQPTTNSGGSSTTP